MSEETLYVLFGIGKVLGAAARWVPASGSASVVAAVTPYAGFGLGVAFC